MPWLDGEAGGKSDEWSVALPRGRSWGFGGTKAREASDVPPLRRGDGTKGDAVARRRGGGQVRRVERGFATRKELGVWGDQSSRSERRPPIKTWRRGEGRCRGSTERRGASQTSGAWLCHAEGVGGLGGPKLAKRATSPH